MAATRKPGDGEVPPPCPRADPARVKLLILDVDGVLTDGSILLDGEGGEIKRFNIRDGAGIRAWVKLGFGAAIITGRGGSAVRRRAEELGISPVVEGASDKAAALASVLQRVGVSADEAAYLGDDWPDLAAMRRVGYPMAVGDADPRVRKIAAFVTERPGGRGAAREAVEHLLSRRGLLEQAVALYDH